LIARYAQLEGVATRFGGGNDVRVRIPIDRHRRDDYASVRGTIPQSVVSS
jgi:hypothetical protein